MFPGLEVVHTHDEEGEGPAAADGVDHPPDTESVDGAVDLCLHVLVAVAAHGHHAVLLAVDPVLQELFDGYPSALVLSKRAAFPLPKHIRLWLPRAPDVISEENRSNKNVR